MSKLITDTIRHTGGSADNITLDGSQNVTCEANLQVDGNVTVTGTLPAAQLTGALPAISGASLTGVTDTQSFRRLNLNGAMQVIQRGTTASVSDGYGGPDRYRWVSSHSVVTMSRSSDVPSGEGFDRSLKLDVTTAGGIGTAATWTQLDYRLEGQDCKSLCYDTSNAKTTTLSFWIKSPKTGIHWCRLYLDKDGKFNSKKYTVSSANTWQKVSVTFAGNTSDGFDYDNTKGLRVSWYFGQGSSYTSGTDADGVEWLDWSSDANRAAVGQVNCMDSTSNDIYLTGVQFEIGSTATDFEHRSFGDELARCQRYSFVIPYGGDSNNTQFIPSTESYAKSSSSVQTQVTFPVPMRAHPSYTGSATDCEFFAADDSDDFALDGFSAYVSVTGDNITGMNIRKTSASSITAGQAGRLIFRATGGYLIFDSEL